MNLTKKTNLSFVCICNICKKMNLASAHKTRKDQQAVPRVMKASALDGPGTNSQQVENRREFRDKTNVGQVFKLSTGFAHFAAEDERHISTKDNNAKKIICGGNHQISIF